MKIMRKSAAKHLKTDFLLPPLLLAHYAPHYYIPGDASLYCQQWQVQGCGGNCIMAIDGGEAGVARPLLAEHEREVQELHRREPRLL